MQVSLILDSAPNGELPVEGDEVFVSIMWMIGSCVLPQLNVLQNPGLLLSREKSRIWPLLSIWPIKFLGLC